MSLTDITTQDDLESLSRETLQAPFPSDIGGGDGYDPAEYSPFPEWADGGRITRDDADATVTTHSGLLSQIGKLNASSGGIIWLDTDEIDATDDDGDNIIKDNVTIASGRGMEDEPTCTIRVDKPDKFLRVEGNGCRFTGFEIEGSETEFFDPRDRYPEAGGEAVYKVGTAEGIFVRGDKTEIDNVSISGMTHAGVIVYRENTATPTPDYKTIIHHSELVDNPCDTLGYGITVSYGSPIITKCFFDNNRHSVAADGAVNCHYVLSESIVGPSGSSHALDMHGKDPGSAEYSPLDENIPNETLKQLRKEAPTDGVKHAGGRISIHHNVVMPMDRTGFKARGCPRLGCQLHNNLWLNPPTRALPSQTGRDGLCYSFHTQEMSVTQVGLSVANNIMDIGSPTASLGPGFSPTENPEAEKFKRKLQAAQKEIHTLKPKAEAADAASSGLNQLFGVASDTENSN